MRASTWIVEFIDALYLDDLLVFGVSDRWSWGVLDGEARAEKNEMHGVQWSG